MTEVFYNIEQLPEGTYVKDIDSKSSFIVEVTSNGIFIEGTKLSPSEINSISIFEEENLVEYTKIA